MIFTIEDGIFMCAFKLIILIYRDMLKEEQKNRQVKIMFETNKEGKQVVAAGSASDLLSSLIDKEYIGKWLLHHIDITYF